MGEQDSCLKSRKNVGRSDDFESIMAPLRIIGRDVTNPARDNLHGPNLGKGDLLPRCLGGAFTPRVVSALKRFLRCRSYDG